MSAMEDAVASMIALEERSDQRWMDMALPVLLKYYSSLAALRADEGEILQLISSTLIETVRMDANKDKDEGQRKQQFEAKI